MRDEIDDVASLILRLEQQKKDLESSLGRVRWDLRAAKERMVKLNYGVEVGSIVTSTIDGKRYRVVGIDPTFEPPWLDGSPERKNGTFGTSVRHLYGEWKL